MNEGTVVEVGVSEGSCMARSGESGISKVCATVLPGDFVKLGFVSRQLKRELLAGATLRIDDLDLFCRLWLESRGVQDRTLNASACLREVEDMEEACRRLRLKLEEEVQ